MQLPQIDIVAKTCVIVQGADFIRTHADFGEVFSEWKLWENARACHRFFTKQGLMKEFTETMSQNVDFLHPRIHNTVVLGCIYHVASSVVTALYDGVNSADLSIVIIELCKLCVLCF